MKSKCQRITISLPNYLYQRLKKRVPARQVSRFVGEALSEKLPVVPETAEEDPVEAFLEMGKHFKKLPLSQILKNIRRGRT
ncbi:MAG: hypothetical protein NUV80_02760 [Candidatus Berkelbacteria bacterium]|nr:hypothetical protein [Candidatus Berkelbacteria bacterium]MCR4307454.1 hypothetical protein [Candidatus Berkelbacteria bacterium]